MVTAAVPLFHDEAWERVFRSFLAEKEHRTGSRRTEDAYSKLLQRFFREVNNTPDQIHAEDVFAFVHGAGPSGKDPAAATIGARLACISSFYRFLIRLGFLAANPCDRLERPRISPPKPRGLGTREINRLLAATPSTPAGKRDRAIMITLLLTARRRSEVLGMRAGDITVGPVPTYAYRGKGGNRDGVSCLSQLWMPLKRRCKHGVSACARWPLPILSGPQAKAPTKG
jgi:site-specific recombinase XerD